ncbi:MAG: divalent-cation tolerance protein CutA [Myxococcales bacterium]|nr:divalent-cation tolerance protein CutA [Myxococcales bacterium]
MRIILTNLPANMGVQVARTLVEERLAACVNLLGVRSFYRWNGVIADDSEETLFIKVSADRVSALRTRLLELHPYELPEILVLEVDAEQSLQQYIHWVRSETRIHENL